ncbi:MAG: hypothetical protein WA739_20880, partial [Candidatus Acidiferrales bacterium]
FGSAPPDVPIGPSSSIPGFLLQILIGIARETAGKADVWPLMADPTTILDPTATVSGPEYP